MEPIAVFPKRKELEFVVNVDKELIEETEENGAVATIKNSITKKVSNLSRFFPIFPPSQASSIDQYQFKESPNLR
jgi:hypothetical protein